MEQVLKATTDLLPQFMFWTLGLAALFVLTALALALLFCRKGWMNLTAQGSRWGTPTSLIGAVVVGIAVGAAVGIQVGAAQTGLKLIERNGPALLHHGLATASRSVAGIETRTEFDVAEVQLVLDRLRELRLVESAGTRALIVNGAFDRIRKPFLQEIENRISGIAPGARISLDRLANESWGKVYNSLQATESNFVRSRIWLGIVWLCVLAALALGFAFAFRRITGAARALASGRGRA